MSRIRIQRLEEDDLEISNQLIAASKSHWRQNADYLAKALPILRLDASWLRENQAFGLVDGEDLVGVLGIETKAQEWYLEHLWIRPDRLGESLGRRAVEFLRTLADQAGMQRIRVNPEPESEGFYRKMGANYTGREVASRIEGGPIFREMVFELS